MRINKRRVSEVKIRRERKKKLSIVVCEYNASVLDVYGDKLKEDEGGG